MFSHRKYQINNLWLCLFMNTCKSCSSGNSVVPPSHCTPDGLYTLQQISITQKLLSSVDMSKTLVTLLFLLAVSLTQSVQILSWLMIMIAKIRREMKTSNDYD